ncbi:DUF805 domain-containing protein [Siansivirga zeaxanthinifaciens]|uniref:DUF805 domain-containing protein n=1 Tax=Siansivirga zeaxanthinifaciens CC-SAMT-1 TaxID=1454006 RepID=A0A0C5W9G6_9FLAO|nr:DUF805 domain-containing protein [Siansivirga zeaxanthinifaciens]AJR03748.1 hypothetical protein AW14_09075 [Siansivirga zeaxanthinifaciens CC-SAMT-1]
MFKNPFSFKGRIRRTEYGLSAIIYYFFITLTDILGFQDGEYAIPFLILLIPIFWFMLAQGAKRCHDRGNSGWYQIIPFYSLWMLFGDGEYGPNAYGNNPKGKGNHDAIEDIGKPTEN